MPALVAADPEVALFSAAVFAACAIGMHLRRDRTPPPPHAGDGRTCPMGCKACARESEDRHRESLMLGLGLAAVGGVVVALI